MEDHSITLVPCHVFWGLGNSDEMTMLGTYLICFKGKERLEITHNTSYDKIHEKCLAKNKSQQRFKILPLFLKCLRSGRNHCISCISWNCICCCLYSHTSDVYYLIISCHSLWVELGLGCCSQEMGHTPGYY